MSSSSKKDLRDRTNEFRVITTTLKRRQKEDIEKKSSSGSRLSNNEQISSKKQKSEFSIKAKLIAKEISSTTLILEELVSLTSRRTMFEDFTADINALTIQVKQNISKINEKIQELQNYINKTNTGGKQITQHNSNVVLLLQSQLANTSTTFKDVLETRRECDRGDDIRAWWYIPAVGAYDIRATGCGAENRQSDRGGAYEHIRSTTRAFELL
ncbi:hypothetical protein BB559_000310 [Furculomyces boomerangus]|uniref:Syntaxin-5 N-terminal Sly1p-binding domain-containing protein n=1 Tax=Furculomyces boomerangus TaxID=61424 RepID=A0A2T9Z5N7_9FUNG|nr:hypothetical protein BB559_000310 [Furculomyces boomerangus]